MFTDAACNGQTVLTVPEGEISVTGHENDMSCQWFIEGPTDSVRARRSSTLLSASSCSCSIVCSYCGLPAYMNMLYVVRVDFFAYMNMPQYQVVKEFSFTLQSLEFASLVGDFVPVSMKIHRSVGIGWLALC